MRISLKVGDLLKMEVSNHRWALKRMAADAAANPDDTFVLVIDEINRTNNSKVLGELFFLLEYRDRSITLQYSDTEFKLPENLKIIGQ